MFGTESEMKGLTSFVLPKQRFGSACLSRSLSLPALDQAESFEFDWDTRKLSLRVLVAPDPVLTYDEASNVYF